MRRVDEITSRGKKRTEDAKRAETRARDIANTLLNHACFKEWAGDVMVRLGFFDNRELTPFCQGMRAGMMREFERLMETADDGDRFLAEVFRNNVLAGRTTTNTEKSK